MTSEQALFAYTDEQLNALQKSLSSERMRPYLILADNNPRLALKLYEWNTRLSESLYGVLQGLEVALRNSMHLRMLEIYGQPDWYEVCPMTATHTTTIRKVKKRILDDKKLLLPCKIVSELTFGFWVGLTSPYYAQSVWDKGLHKAFIQRLGRKQAQKRLDKIRKLRNRVAHHESILARNLADDFSIILETVHWICPITAEWLRCNSSFHVRYSEKPSISGISSATPQAK
jgi:Abi-like protein